MSTETTDEKLSFFDKYLTLWIIFCIAIGVLIGKIFPQGINLLSKFEVAHVNIPVAILIWFMIYPMMVQIDFSSVIKVKEQPRGLIITLIVNWLIKPFTMAIFATVFLKYIFSSLINPALAKEYIAGAILLGAAPCTAMVFVWSYLTDGNPAYTLIQVSINDLVILVAFVPIVQFLLGVSKIHVPYDTLIYSIIFFVAIPLIGGYLSRVQLLKHKGTNWFENTFLKILRPVTIIGLLLTLIILFAFQGNIILGNPIHILLIAIPLTIQTYFIFAIGYIWGKKWRLPHSISSPAAIIGASNFFELAVAVAVSLFGLKNGAALCTVVGVLTEVPIMLSLVHFSNKTRHWFMTKKEVDINEIRIERKKPLWEKILIATDLSKGSEDIVNCIARTGKDFAQEAKLVHVISVVTSGGFDETLGREERSIIEAQTEILQRTGISSSFAFTYGVPLVEINRIIKEDNIKLLVLGSHSRSVAKDILLGSFSDSIIRNLSIPAIIVKFQKEDTHTCSINFSGNLFFPTDFSENAKTAFQVLTKLAAFYNPKVTLYHIQDRNIIFPHLEHKLPEFNRIDTDRMNNLKKILKENGVKDVILKIEMGYPKQAIINEINHNNYDLAVMGTQGKGWVEELFIGSVTHAIVRKTKLPLLLVPYL